jgi:methionyl-tRNA synthetase
MNKKILIGVAWPYVNGDLHPGHIAGCYLPADIFARYKRLQGQEVVMVSGCDCFGTPITIQADKEGVTPQEIVEKYVPRTTSLLLETYKISFDSFTRTDTDLHRKITQEFFLNLIKDGKIIKKSSEQYYSAEDNKFLPDRYVEGECTHCHAKEQRGDQCENCGRSLAVGDLINPYAKLSKFPVTLKTTEHYFVDLSKFKTELSEYLKDKEKSWRPWVWKEAKAWVDELQSRAITRDIDWGVEIPTKEIEEKYPEYRIEGAENKRFYVWFDAVIGYFSEGIKLFEKQGISREEFLAKFWDKDDENLEHYLFVGKDNLFFHTLWWQSLLIGQKDSWTPGKSLKLANNVPVNQFLNLENQKFSKSRNIYIDNTKLVNSFGLDAVRFYLASIMPENADANWKWDDFVATNNNELNSNIGNFIHRTLSFYKNKLNNVIPDKRSVDPESGSSNLFELSVQEEINSTFDQVSTYLDKFEFVNALNRILKLSQFANKYFNDKAPWKSLAENRADCEKTIYNCLQVVEALRILLNPFTPNASDKLSELLGIEVLPSDRAKVSGQDYLAFKEVKEFTLAKDPEPLFKKIEPEDIVSFNNPV